MANSIFSQDTIPPADEEDSRSDRAAQTFSFGRASALYA